MQSTSGVSRRPAAATEGETPCIPQKLQMPATPDGVSVKRTVFGNAPRKREAQLVKPDG